MSKVDWAIVILLTFPGIWAFVEHRLMELVSGKETDDE